MKMIRNSLTISAAVALCMMAATWADAASKEKHFKKSKSSHQWNASDYDDGRDYSYKHSRQLHTKLRSTIVVGPEVIVYPPPPPRHRRFSVDIDTNRSSYYVGSDVRVTFSATHDSYVYIFSEDTSGITRQIFPNYYDRDNFVRGGRTYSIPDRGYSLVTDGPAGRESLQIVAYRYRYEALDHWHHFDRHDLFPRQRYSSETMGKSIDREIKSLRVHPRGRGHSKRNDDYAEDWTHFTTRYPHHWRERDRHRHDSPYDHYSTRDYSYREGSIRITSAPSGAEVYIDGVYAGRTPGTFDAAVGKREVTLYRAGYKTKEMSISVTKAGETSVSVSMKRDRW